MLLSILLYSMRICVVLNIHLKLDTHAERKKHSTFFIINKIEPVTEIRQLDLYSNKPFYTVYIFT